MKFLRVVVVLAIGCGSSTDDPELSSTDEPIVNPAAPYVGPGSATVSLPSLGAHARVTEHPSVNAISADTPHHVEFTDGVDPVAAPIEDRSTTEDGIFDAWRDTLAGVANAAYVQPPAFVP